MALIHEDGTGKADAESYASVAVADAYHAARGHAAWAALSTEDKEVALRKATAYMLRYEWRGQRATALQALEWPRVGVVIDGFELDGSVIPQAVQHACCELALRASTMDLSPDESRQQILSERVGPVSVTYAPGAQSGVEFRAVDIMLKRMLRGGGDTIVLARG